jgi:hypothetical protein
MGERIEALGDISAIAAARSLIAGDEFQDLPEAEVWKARWRRAGFTDAKNASAIAVQAAAASPLRSRKGIRTVAYQRPWQEIAKDLGQSGGKYAIGGIAAAEGGDVRSGTTWPIFYVDDVDSALRSASLTEAEEGERSFSILPFDAVSSVGVVGRTVLAGLAKSSPH